jgi:hypothetical protein
VSFEKVVEVVSGIDLHRRRASAYIPYSRQFAVLEGFYDLSR